MIERYTFHVEKGHENFRELMPLYKAHYDETQERMIADGFRPSGPFNPRLDQYLQAWIAGHLLNYVIRFNGEAVGASNIYLSTDMHSGDFFAAEDTIFVRKDHRNGVGKKLTRFILDDLKKRGVKYAIVDAVTDLRVAKVWKRMGFRERAIQMVYDFEENA